MADFAPSAATMADPVLLAQELIRTETAGAGESRLAMPLAAALEDAGFAVQLFPSAAGRENLLATWRGGGSLVLSGHLDTVPFTPDGWSHDPLGGDVAGGMLYGRGASDMKAGVAAMVVAALRASRSDASPFTLAFTIGEETGCTGAADLSAAGLLPERPILVIGESTDNRLRLGHKGATWLRVTAHGTQAHGSRPDLGDNAIDMLADLIVALRGFPAQNGAAHPDLGAPTLNVGRIWGGLQTNLVPALAATELDIRTVPGTSLAEVTAAIEAFVPHAEVDTLLDLAAVWTPTDQPLTRRIHEHVAGIVGDHETGAVSYFTDAAALSSLHPTVFIVGPGGVDQPHTVDERCSVERIGEAESIYRRLIADADALEGLR